MVNVKERFSKNLFWNVDVSQLDVDANRRYVIGRVLDRGTDNDLRLAFSYYTFPVVVEVAKSLRTLERRALSFISANLTVKTGSGADLVASKLYRYSEQDQEDIQFLMLRGGVTLDVVLPKYRVPEF